MLSKPNIQVTFTVRAEDRITLQPLGGTVSGKTDANGYVVLNYYISWDYDPDLIDMMAYVSSSGYTTIQATGNYTTTGNTLYPEFWVKEDMDQNGVADDWESPLAEKFSHGYKEKLSQNFILKSRYKIKLPEPTFMWTIHRIDVVNLQNSIAHQINSYSSSIAS